MLQYISSNLKIQHFSLKLTFIFHFNFYLYFHSYTLACFTSYGRNTKQRKSVSQINCNYDGLILSELCKASSTQTGLASPPAHRIYHPCISANGHTCMEISLLL